MDAIYNTRNLYELCPIDVAPVSDEGDGVQEKEGASGSEGGRVSFSPPLRVRMPRSRLQYVSEWLRCMQVAYHVSEGYAEAVIRSIPEDPPRRSRKTAQHSPVDKVLMGIRVHSLRQFDYEVWHQALAACPDVRDLDGGLYCPLCAPHARIVPFQPDEVLALRAALMSKLWYCKQPEEDVRERLEKMRERMEEHIAAAASRGGGRCFVRLSTHSPKDVPPLRVDDGNGNDVVLPRCCVRNGSDLLNLILRSERLMTDLDMCMHSASLVHRPSSIIFAPWRDMDSAMEFRCFVREFKLVAVSQYEWTEVIEGLQCEEVCRSLKAAIENFVSEIANYLPFSHCVLDVYVRAREEQSRVWRPQLIELNPYFPDLTSGSCLFEWKKDAALLCPLEGNEAGCARPTAVFRVRCAKEGVQTRDY